MLAKYSCQEYCAHVLVDMYRRWLFDVWGKGDAAAAEQLLAEDLVDHNRLPGQPAGRAGDLWAANAVRTAFPDLHFTLDVAFGHDDLVTGRWTMTGTHTGPLELVGIPATGRPIEMTGQEIFRARDGRFVEVWHQEDIGGLMRGLDMQPPGFILRLAAWRSARSFRRQTTRNPHGA
jgi:predicted ester cyclase